jgi:hypothetical protein
MHHAIKTISPDNEVSPLLMLDPSCCTEQQSWRTQGTIVLSRTIVPDSEVSLLLVSDPARCTDQRVQHAPGLHPEAARLLYA